MYLRWRLKKLFKIISHTDIKTYFVYTLLTSTHKVWMDIQLARKDDFECSQPKSLDAWPRSQLESWRFIQSTPFYHPAKQNMRLEIKQTQKHTISYIIFPIYH